MARIGNDQQARSPKERANAIRLPQRISLDVGDEYRLAAERRGTARAGLRTDDAAVDGLVVRVRQRRRGAMLNTGPGVVHQQNRGDSLGRHLLDEPHQFGEDVGQGRAGRQHLQGPLFARLHTPRELAWIVRDVATCANQQDRTTVGVDQHLADGVELAHRTVRPDIRSLWPNGPPRSTAAATWRCTRSRSSG